MRSFEIYLAVGCAVAVLWPALFGVRPRRGIVAVAMVALLAAQLRVEGFRWQMLVLYLVAAGLAIGDVITVERELPWVRRVGRGVFGLVGLGLAMAPALVLPVPDFPTPTGPMAVGTVDATITDADRPPQDVEGEGELPPQTRTLPVRVWYPAQPVDEPEIKPWDPDVALITPAMAERAGTPGFFFRHLRHVSSPTVPGAPVEDGAFPVLVFSHGWREFKTVAIDQVVDLVSQGYIVIAPDHPGVAAVTVVDGEEIRYDQSLVDDPEATEEHLAEQRADLLEMMALDLVAVLDEAEAGVTGAYGDLVRSMDLNSVGMWGHGLGGGAVVQTCLDDDRCDAMAGTDAMVEWLPNQVLATTATRPMLFMRSDEQRDTMNDAVLRGIVDRSETISYWVGVTGAETADFTALPLVSPFADSLGMKGPIEGDRMVEINHRFLSGFFDRFLLETGSATLETVSFDEVDLELVDNR